MEGKNNGGKKKTRVGNKNEKRTNMIKLEKGDGIYSSESACSYIHNSVYKINIRNID